MSPVAAVPGNTRLRHFQLGKETTLLTPVTATRRFPWSFAPTIDPKWTWPTADTGTLDQALDPYRMIWDISGPATGILAYDDAPYLWAGLVKSGVTPSSHVWTFTPASKSQDSFEIFTAEWGDETADQWQLASGIVTDLTLTYPDDLGPVQVNATYRFANAVNPLVSPASLDVDPSPVWVYMADTQLYLDSTAGGIGGTPMVNALHGATIQIQTNDEVKAFANGSNTRFEVAGYGRGLRQLTATFNFAKATAALAEIQNWIAQNPVERFVSLRTQSPVLVPTTGLNYVHEVRFPGFWFTDNPSGTYQTYNTTNELVLQNRFNTTLGYPFSAIITNALAGL
jgi:hypothetical protein